MYTVLANPRNDTLLRSSVYLCGVAKSAHMFALSLRCYALMSLALRVMLQMWTGTASHVPWPLCMMLQTWIGTAFHVPWPLCLMLQTWIGTAFHVPWPLCMMLQTWIGTASHVPWPPCMMLRMRRGTSFRVWVCTPHTAHSPHKCVWTCHAHTHTHIHTNFTHSTRTCTHAHTHTQTCTGVMLWMRRCWSNSE